MRESHRRDRRCGFRRLAVQRGDVVLEIERQWISPVRSLRPALDAGEQTFDARAVAVDRDSLAPSPCVLSVTTSALSPFQRIFDEPGTRSSAPERMKTSDSSAS